MLWKGIIGKILELIREIYSFWTRKFFNKRILLMESVICVLFWDSPLIYLTCKGIEEGTLNQYKEWKYFVIFAKGRFMHF